MLGVPVVAGVPTDAGVSLLLAPSVPLSLLLQCIPIVVASCCCRSAVADILASSGVPAVAFNLITKERNKKNSGGKSNKLVTKLDFFGTWKQ